MEMLIDLSSIDDLIFDRTEELEENYVKIAKSGRFSVCLTLDDIAYSIALFEEEELVEEWCASSQAELQDSIWEALHMLKEFDDGGNPLIEESIDYGLLDIEFEGMLNVLGIDSTLHEDLINDFVATLSMYGIEVK